MRVLMDQESYDALLARQDHPADCYVRPGEYLHHMYRNAIKYVVAPALYAALAEAQQRNDHEAIAHLSMHASQLRELTSAAEQAGRSEPTQMLGDPGPGDDLPQPRTSFMPVEPTTWEE